MGTTREELKEQIENLERILNSGASSITEDGQTTTFDIQATRVRLNELRARLNKIEGRRARRPIMGQIDLSGE